MNTVKSTECVPTPDIRGSDKLNRMRYPAFAEIKYDGEYGYFKGGVLYNKNGLKRSGFPVTQELLLLGGVELMGELHFEEGRLHDIYNLLSNKNSHDLNFTVFDCPSLADKPFDQRRSALARMIRGMTHVRLSKGRVVKSRSEVLEMFNEAVRLGHEGIVVKSLDSRLGVNWIKLKRKLTADLVVKEIDPVQERVEVEVPGDNPKRCGVKVMEHIKRTLLVGDIIEVEHQGTLSGGGLRHPVFKRKREHKRVFVDV